METGRDRLEEIDNIDDIRFDEEGLEVDLSFEDDPVGTLEVVKPGGKKYEHQFQEEMTTAESPLGLGGSEKTEGKKRRWLRKVFNKHMQDELSGKEFSNKIWKPLTGEVTNRGIVSEFYDLPSIYTLQTEDMIQKMVIEKGVDGTINYPALLKVNYDGEEKWFDLDTRSILQINTIESAFLQHFCTIPEPIIELGKKDWKKDVIARLKSEGKVEKTEERVSTQMFLRDRVIEQVRNSQISHDREAVLNKPNLIELDDGILWLPNERIKEILEQERSKVNLRKMAKWCSEYLADTNPNPKPKWVGGSAHRFWGFDPEKCDVDIDGETGESEGGGD
ncbi:hypothetical protein AKJ62_01295 [candidate division MSBL1 archaeon SCGC-AAA259D14]|uniref:Uncharacterized protein n=1 Tax=candidate division MSBL1 archaeon SCGC-AAA259D14 TaxID=1698261 RepID=A0A133U7Y0_9EURY|nr:hypothetical protein AKJ62_01295 [candidate division MSBL1 archaeon SCGC-AAA259D14]